MNILEKPLYIQIDKKIFLGTTELIENKSLLKNLEIKRVLIISPFKTTKDQRIPRVFLFTDFLYNEIIVFGVREESKISIIFSSVQRLNH